MKRFVGQVSMALAFTGIFGANSVFAAEKVSPKAKAANAAHSEAPAPVMAAPGSTAGSPMATGEGLQRNMTPEMSKWITSMKACHKGGKVDQGCHDRVLKGCEAKLAKEECAKITTQVEADAAKSKM